MGAPKDPEKRDQWIENQRQTHLGKPAWNKDLTKKTDERVRKYGESSKGKHDYWKGKIGYWKGKNGEESCVWQGGSSEWWHNEAYKLHGKSHCEHCLKSNEDNKRQTNCRLSMHCVSGRKYIHYSNLDAINWECLCNSCHHPKYKE